MRVNHSSANSIRPSFGLIIGNIDRKGMSAKQINAITNALPYIREIEGAFKIDIFKLTTDDEVSFNVFIPKSRYYVKASLPVTNWRGKLFGAKEVCNAESSAFKGYDSEEDLAQKLKEAVLLLKARFSDSQIVKAQNKHVADNNAAIAEEKAMTAAEKGLAQALAR